MSRLQVQEHALPREIDRRDLHAVPGADEDERVVREAADGLVDRRPAEPGDVLQILDREKAARLQLAIDDEVLDPLVGEFEEVDAIAAMRRLPSPRRRPRALVRPRLPPAMSASSNASAYQDRSN